MAQVMIPYSTQYIDQDDIDAVVNVLKSPMLTQGPAVEQFEKDVCNAVNAHFGVAMNSATSALHAACDALGMKQGDVVWVSPISFAATANCVLYTGATVDFVDIDPDTYNMSATALEEKLTKTKVAPNFIIVTHMAGMPADMRAINTFARTVGARIIEDAAHALGAIQHQRCPVGACRYSDITVFSFHPVKPITTGEGGMAVTNISYLADSMRMFRSHGMNNGNQVMLGYNYRMSDMAAALGSSQLPKLSNSLKIRDGLADIYFAELTNVRHQAKRIQSTTSHHLYVIRHENADNIQGALINAGYRSPTHYKPIYFHQYYLEKLNFPYGLCPEAESYHNEAVTLPLHQKLTEEQQAQVISIVKANT